MSKIDKVELYPFSPLKLLHETRKLTPAQAKFFIALVCLYFERSGALDWYSYGTSSLQCDNPEEKNAAVYAPYCGVTKKTFIKMIDALYDAGCIYLDDHGRIALVFAEEIREAVIYKTHRVLTRDEMGGGSKPAKAPIADAPQEQEEDGKVVSSAMFRSEEEGKNKAQGEIAGATGTTEVLEDMWGDDDGLTDEERAEVWGTHDAYVKNAIKEEIAFQKELEEEFAKQKMEEAREADEARIKEERAGGDELEKKPTKSRSQDEIDAINKLARKKEKEIGRDPYWFYDEAEYDEAPDERLKKASYLADTAYGGNFMNRLTSAACQKLRPTVSLVKLPMRSCVRWTPKMTLLYGIYINLGVKN